MELNYGAITNSPVYAKGRKLFETTGKQKSKFIWLFFLVLAAVFAIAFTIPTFIPVLVIGTLAAVPVALIKLIKKGAPQWKIGQQALTEFAKQNSFTYQEVPYMQVSWGNNLSDVQLSLPFKARLTTNSGNMKGSIFNQPFDYLSGSIELIDYRGLSAQSGSQESRSLSALCITLPISLPKLYIDTKRNNVAGFEAKANNIDDLQIYNLEGEFPQYYKVFAQKDDQINVLGVLTPEVMQKLLEYKYYDVWIDGNRLVVFALNTPFEYLAGVPEIFPTAEMLLHEIDKIARKLRKEQ